MRAGEPVGSYLLVSRLGSGYGGETWAARPAAGGGELVLKLIDLREAPGWEGVELFRREAEALRRLEHPRIPRCLGHFEAESGGRLLLVLAMEKIEGRDLQRLADSGRRFADAEVASILAGLADILAYLGSLRPPVVHRDVNPKNVLLGPDGGVSLVDFSGVQDALRSAASPGATLVGTAGYTPVEQVAGRATPRSDLYAAAATALFLLSGRNPAELPARGLKPDLGSFPGLSPALAAVLDDWLEPDEARRLIGAAGAAEMLRGRAPLPGPAAAARRPAPEGRVPLPSGSRVAIERDAEHIRVLLPPAGRERGGTGLVGASFALVWLGFVAFWTFSSVAMGAPIFFTLFSLPFWAVGLAMARFMIKGALGSTELVLDRSGLRFSQRLLGLGGSRSWPLAELGPFRIEDSLYQVRGRGARELAIEAGATRLGFGRGLSGRELGAIHDALNGWLQYARELSVGAGDPS
ncbi:MAG TPA: protein kinase [Spirochaetales bacterium]|nr:protein kinase [Spirochaetales bacterium]HRY55365.1 protein kinase [Spirochaetia bacterium]HRZ65659.1 protein kinase [Spirochaetia bacterium]